MNPAEDVPITLPQLAGFIARARGSSIVLLELRVNGTNLLEAEDGIAFQCVPSDRPAVLRTYLAALESMHAIAMAELKHVLKAPTL